MSKEKPKKGGMVLIIGMGAKPKKEKDGVKKADEMTAPRKRGGLGNRERKRMFAFKNKLRQNPNEIERSLKKLNIPEKMFRMYLQKVEGMTLEEAKTKDVNFPKLIDEVKRINNANLGQFDEAGNIKNKKLQESMQRQGIRLKDFKQSIEDDPFMNFQDRMAKLRSERGPRIKLDRAPRRRVGQKKKRNPKGDMFEIPGDDPEDQKPKSKIPFYKPTTLLEQERQKRRDRLSQLKDKQLDSGENYKDLYSQMFQGIEEAKANDPRIRDEEDKFTDFEGDYENAEDEKLRFYERLFQANTRDPTEAALRELGQPAQRDMRTMGQKFPGFTVEGRVKSAPSTEFHPENPKGPLSSPQQENKVATSSDSRNVMDPAWALLKGAMKTIDLIAQETNTMEEALQSMKESFPNMPSQQAIQLVTQARNQQARERMSSPKFSDFRETPTQPKTDSKRTSVDEDAVANIIDSSPKEMMDRNPNMKNFASPTGDLDDVATSSDSRNVMDAAWGLLKGNRSMRDAEGRAINHPAAMVYDELAHQIDANEIQDQYPYVDLDDESAADRMEEMRNPTHQRKVMNRLKQGGHATPLHLRFAMQRDEENKRNLDKYRQEAREQTHNIMDFGNEDTSPGPNYGITRMPRPGEEEEEARKRLMEQAQQPQMADLFYPTHAMQYHRN